MANSVCSSPLIFLNITDKPGLISHNYACTKANWMSDARYSSKNAAFEALKVKATDNKPSTNQNSLLCPDCEGNGTKSCSQCKGAGVNSVDHFDGRFKTGASCWLCRGKKEILCGNCNGAGFVGGFLSAIDDTSS